MMFSVMLKQQSDNQFWTLFEVWCPKRQKVNLAQQFWSLTWPRIDQTIYRSLDAQEIPETPKQTNEALNIFKETNHSSMDDCLEFTFVVTELAKHSWQACAMPS